MRRATRGLLALGLATGALACNTEAIYDMVFGDEGGSGDEPTVWQVTGLVHDGMTFVVETRPGVRVVASVESNDSSSRAPFEVEATADSDGKATLEIRPEKPEEGETFTARIRVEGDEDGQMVHPRFKPAPLTSARLVPAGGSEGGGSGDELTLHIACEDKFIIHPKTTVQPTAKGHELRLFVPDATQMTLGGETYTFEPATLSFEGEDQDFEKKTFDLPVPAAAITIPPGGFADQLHAMDLGEPVTDIGPRFVISLSDGTKCRGSIVRATSTGFDLPAFLESPKATSLPGDEEGWDGELVALRYHKKSYEDEMGVTVYGDRKAPRQALRYVIKEEAKVRVGSPCKYKNTETGGKESVERRARDRVLTIYDRTTGEVAKTITVSAAMPGCARETYGTGSFENAASNEKVDKRIEAWAENAL